MTFEEFEKEFERRWLAVNRNAKSVSELMWPVMELTIEEIGKLYPEATMPPKKKPKKGYGPGK